MSLEADPTLPRCGTDLNPNVEKCHRGRQIREHMSDEMRAQVAQTSWRHPAGEVREGVELLPRKRDTFTRWQHQDYF